MTISRTAALVLVLVAVTACGEPSNSVESVDRGQQRSEALAFEPPPSLVQGDWTPVLVSEDLTWLVLGSLDATGEPCYSLRSVDGNRWPDSESLSAAPWPILPAAPGYDEAPEPATCMTEVSEGMTSVTGGIDGLQFGPSSDGGVLLLGTTTPGTRLRSVSSTLTVDVFTAGTLFVVLAPSGDTMLDSLTVESGSGDARTCDTSGFKIVDLTIHCDWGSQGRP